MGLVVAGLLALSMALTACAGRGAPASTTPASKATTAQATSKCPQPAQPSSKWREMTWAEYYADVRERAARRGVTVVWVMPPEVRKPPNTPSAGAVAACTH